MEWLDWTCSLFLNHSIESGIGSAKEHYKVTRHPEDTVTSARGLMISGGTRGSSGYAERIRGEIERPSVGGDASGLSFETEVLLVVALSFFSAKTSSVLAPYESVFLNGWCCVAVTFGDVAVTLGEEAESISRGVFVVELGLLESIDADDTCFFILRVSKISFSNEESSPRLSKKPGEVSGSSIVGSPGVSVEEISESSSESSSSGR